MLGAGTCKRGSRPDEPAGAALHAGRTRPGCWRGSQQCCLHSLCYARTQLRAAVQAQPCSAGDAAGYERRNSAADDVVIVSALRTPVTKVRKTLPELWPLQSIRELSCLLQARRGGLKDCTGDQLMAAVFKAVIQETGVEPAVCTALLS